MNQSSELKRQIKLQAGAMNDPLQRMSNSAQAMTGAQQIASMQRNYLTQSMSEKDIARMQSLFNARNSVQWVDGSSGAFLPKYPSPTTLQRIARWFA